MQYLGGKSRISKEISAIINKYSEDKEFVSLFCGTCSIESLVVSKTKTLNDFQEYLIELFKALQNKWDCPEYISEEEYKRIKNNIDENKALSAFAGFGCSFGGKWWGGYARQTKGLNYAATAKRSLMKKMNGLYDAKFYNLDYRLVPIRNNSVIYCDPPYEGTTKYSNSNNFSHKDFWEYMRVLSKTNKVFVSELKAPDDFKVVWQKDFTRNLDSTVVFNSTEKLFTL